MRGLFTALVTPFDSQDRLNVPGLRANIRHQIENRVDGIVVLGTTGESPTLTDEENETIIETALEEAKGKVKVIVGTGCYATRNTIEKTRQAEKLGADGALVISPYYNRPSQEGLYMHFRSVAESTSLPIIVYNHLGRTGVNIQLDTLKRLAAIDNIVAIKECSENVSQLEDLVETMRAFRPDFKILTGCDNVAYPLMALGGDGVICVASNLFPDLMRDLVGRALEGDLVGARQIHQQLYQIFKLLAVETNPVPIKYAMNTMERPAGHCRLPLAPLLPENAAALKAALNSFALAFN
jgi:4-hydroxy-tetrahydrodipicolinate synthase